MLKFATSVSWRVLRAFEATGELSEFPDEVKTKVDDTLREWAHFLLGSRPHPGHHEQHMILGDVIESTSIPNAPPAISRYLARAIDPYVAFNQDSAISYSKMGRFILFGFVGMRHPRRWKGTKLHTRHGTFGQGDIEIPSDAGEFIMGRARLTADNFSQISERQRERIRKSYERDLDRAAQSETFRALYHDVLMFEDHAFEVTQPTANARTTQNAE